MNGEDKEPKICSFCGREDFNAMTVKDLKAYAQEKGIAIESKAKKAEIIDTIMAAEKE